MIAVMDPGSFFAELKRRNVYKVAVAYVVVAWLLIQAASIFLPAFDAPPWVLKASIIFLAAGFPVALVLSWAFEITPEGIKRESEVDAGQSITARTGRKIVALTVALAAIAAGLLVFQLLRPRLTEKTPPSSAASEAIPDKSIAVLPFENLSDDKANAYFVSGMRDELLTKLAQLGGLKVVSRTSADKFQSHPPDIRTVGRELGVAYVLEGSVQKSGDDVLINVQLIDARGDNHVWAQSYRRSFSNIFDVEAELGAQIADALKLNLAPNEALRLRKAATGNAHAHDLFLRGRALNAHADEGSFQEAIRLMEEAVKEDRNYSPAWAELASAYIGLADAYIAPSKVLQPMRNAAEEAVRTDESAGAGHVWLGTVAMIYDRNFPLARREFERALALDPNSADARRWYGRYLAQVEGDFSPARHEVQRAEALDPLNGWPVAFDMDIAIGARDYENALKLAQRLLAIAPHWFYDTDPLGHVYVAKGAWQEAAKRYETLPPDTLRRPNFELAIAYAHSGRAEEARRILAELQSLATKVYIDHTHIAAIAAALGDHDLAFTALRQAGADRSARICTPRYHHEWLGPLFDDPRFAEFEHDFARSAILAPEKTK
ncbi:MAG: adenylate cyclase [Verrucomicrobiota bacterium]|jgi:TolB-like protein/Tfp pilus assembly protein PilF